MRRRVVKDLGHMNYSDFSDSLKPDNIGANIRYFRTMHAEMTQKEFAQEINVVRSTLANYELIQRAVPLDVLQRIADLFNISLDILCYRKSYLEREGSNNENI